MKKTFLIIFALAATFGLGFAFNDLIIHKPNDNMKMKKVTGIGGIFLDAKTPTAWAGS